MIEFRIEYPLKIVPNSGLKTSLSYYLYSDKLSWEALRLDPEGIPQAWYRITGTAYWPAYIAWYGLVHLGHYLRSGDPEELMLFLKQIDWLEKHAVTRIDGAVIWPMNFDYPVGDTLLKSPWISSHAQGLAISALVRGWRITRNPRLRELLQESSKVFEQDHRDGGIRVSLKKGALYTEVPNGCTPGILDGFLTSLVALYDLAVETEDPRVKELFCEGVAGLKESITEWDYRGKWTWYGSREYLCSPAYHFQNRLLLMVLAELTGESTLGVYAEKWNPGNLDALDRAEIYVVHNWTLNMSRLRYRTWRNRPITKHSVRLNSKLLHHTARRDRIAEAGAKGSYPADAEVMDPVDAR